MKYRIMLSAWVIATAALIFYLFIWDEYVYSCLRCCIDCSIFETLDFFTDNFSPMYVFAPWMLLGATVALLVLIFKNPDMK